jgi:hypothetical protein
MNVRNASYVVCIKLTRLARNILNGRKLKKITSKRLAFVLEEKYNGIELAILDEIKRRMQVVRRWKVAECGPSAEFIRTSKTKLET